MDSELSLGYAFIEHIQAFNDDEEITENSINDIERNKYTIEEF